MHPLAQCSVFPALVLLFFGFVTSAWCLGVAIENAITGHQSSWTQTETATSPLTPSSGSYGSGPTLPPSQLQRNVSSNMTSDNMSNLVKREFLAEHCYHQHRRCMLVPNRFPEMHKSAHMHLVECLEAFDHCVSPYKRPFDHIDGVYHDTVPDVKSYKRSDTAVVSNDTAPSKRPQKRMYPAQVCYVSHHKCIQAFPHLKEISDAWWEKCMDKFKRCLSGFERESDYQEGWRSSEYRHGRHKAAPLTPKDPMPQRQNPAADQAQPWNQIMPANARQKDMPTIYPAPAGSGSSWPAAPIGDQSMQLAYANQGHGAAAGGPVIGSPQAIPAYHGSGYPQGAPMTPYQGAGGQQQPPMQGFYPSLPQQQQPSAGQSQSPAYGSPQVPESVQPPLQGAAQAPPQQWQQAGPPGVQWYKMSDPTGTKMDANVPGREPIEDSLAKHYQDYYLNQGPYSELRIVDPGPKITTKRSEQELDDDAPRIIPESVKVPGDEEHCLKLYEQCVLNPARLNTMFIGGPCHRQLQPVCEPIYERLNAHFSSEASGNDSDQDEPDEEQVENLSKRSLSYDMQYLCETMHGRYCRHSSPVVFLTLTECRTLLTECSALRFGEIMIRALDHPNGTPPPPPPHTPTTITTKVTLVQRHLPTLHTTHRPLDQLGNRDYIWCFAWWRDCRWHIPYAYGAQLSCDVEASRCHRWYDLLSARYGSLDESTGVKFPNGQVDHYRPPPPPSPFDHL